MVDLAIGTVESGIINFNLLNKLLHIIVNNSNMENTLIELLEIDNENLSIPKNSINSPEHHTSTPPGSLQEKDIDLSENNSKINKIISVDNELSNNSISIESFKINESNKKLLKKIIDLEKKLKRLESFIGMENMEETSTETLDSIRNTVLKEVSESKQPKIIPTIGKKSLTNSYDMSNDHIEEINDEIYYAFNEYDSLKDEEEEEEECEEESSYDQLEGIFTSLENLKIQKADLREVQSFNEKITNLEDKFIQTIKEVQDMMDVKLDKCSIIDLKKFVQNHIEYFKSKLEDFSKLICEESSGTVKLLRNNNCICCGKVVTQRDRENPAFVPKLDESHGSLRYCGGSHTKLDSYEKAFRNDEILLQKFGPVPHVANFLIEGNDGKLYRGSKAVCLCNSNCEFQ